LLSIVLEGADKANYKLSWSLDQILAALCIIFGGAQFKENTDLWAVTRKGMMTPPDFGLYLSRDRFKHILRYWAYGFFFEEMLGRVVIGKTLDRGSTLGAGSMDLTRLEMRSWI
jgi:hypothetical protein